MVARLQPFTTTLLALALFAVYAAGACPSIYVGDSGELAAAVHVLGIPHPTGYPLYVLLGKLWTLLVPIGSVAYRLSLFSAVCAALACAVLYRAGRELQLPLPAALLSALLFAFGASFWGEANVQRAYALNALFVALATVAALRWNARRDPRWLIALFFICGLGATNHTFMAIYAAAALVAVALRVVVRTRRSGASRAVRDLGLVWSRNNSGTTVVAGVARTLTACAVVFVVGLLPYLYLPLRSRMDPPLDWGDPQTLHGFLRVVLRRDFWERAWLERPVDLVTITADYLSSFAAEMTWPGAALAAVGLLVGRGNRWPRVLFALVMLGNLVAMAAHGSRSDLFIWHRYYVPSYAMAALLAGCGYDVVLDALPPRARLVPLAIPALLLSIGWRAADRSRYHIADAYSRAVLHSLPPGATLIATDDNILFVLIYLTMVEGSRPDVHLVLQGVGAADLPALRFNPDVDPLYFTHHPNWNRADLDIVPIGLVFQARRAGQPPPPPTVPLWELPGERDDAVPKDYLSENLVGQLHYMLGFTFERRDWRLAREQFERAARASPHNDVLFYNLGLIYQHNGLLDDARDAFARSQAINPRYIAGGSRARASDRLAEIEAERQRLAALEHLLAVDPPLQGQKPGTADYHLRLANLFEARGESVAARGQRLLALEGGAPSPPGGGGG